MGSSLDLASALAFSLALAAATAAALVAARAGGALDEPRPPQQSAHDQSPSGTDARGGSRQ